MTERRRSSNARHSWRFPIFLILLAIGTVIGIRKLGLEHGVLAGFDFAAALFLLSCLRIFSHDTQRMRDSAAANDAGRVLRLTIALLLTLVIFAAMTAQIVDPRALSAAEKSLVAGSIILVWLFANTMYTLHYAHLYYSADEEGADRAGLVFPGTREPRMADFAYFAFTVGVAVQTADVAITSARIRRMVTIHAILGFFFNIGVLALTINVLGS